ncbi:MAG: poly[(R)-3-hydroxyalkanoate] polymerase subunit PhaC, partial [Alphaproteobacteria bacterium]|nr:poly[(R)-3-hydroxyalkanoate] polymerase subunit PhaC [Alphaproteobacteria bacterium]
MQRLTSLPVPPAPTVATSKKPRKAKPARSAGARAKAPAKAPAKATKPSARERAQARPAEPPRPEARPAPGPAEAGPTAQQLDIQAFSKNIARMVEQGGRALAAYLKAHEQRRGGQESTDLVTDAVKTLSRVLQYWLADPQRALALQAMLGQSYLDLWANAAKRLAGEPVAPVAA